MYIGRSQPLIGFDARMIEHSGIGTRIQNLLKFWVPTFENEKIFLFGNPDLIQNHKIPNNSEIIPYLVPIYQPKELLGHPMFKKMDLLEIPHFNAPTPYLKKSIITIHDIIPYRMREIHGGFKKRAYLYYQFAMLKNFSHSIVTVSDFTKTDLLNAFDWKRDNIHRIYNGVDRETFNSKSNFKSISVNLPKEYILTVGIGKDHKNFPFLWKNYKFLMSQKKLHIPLVVMGAGNFWPSDFPELTEEDKQNIILLPKLPLDEIPCVYQKAKFMIYPSLYEGFGFPAVEAGAMGCPVLSSNRTVLPEILGDSAVYFDPHSDEDLREKIIFLLQEPKELKTMSLKGIENSKQFSWQEACNLHRDLRLEFFREKGLSN
jgi:glycosyltransferase involved in cell wall biosynthesis